jgi:hypothetical protein
MAKIERFRQWSDIVTAVDLVAEQHGVDSEQLAVAHFAWLLDQCGDIGLAA